ncbi:MAG: hypothetical protein ACI8UO_005367, partial [Verrucomicrobiales bacterium]
WINQGRQRIVDLEARMERDREELSTVDEEAWDDQTRRDQS